MESRIYINRRRPYVTYALIGVNVALFLVEQLLELLGMPHGEMLLRMGAKHNVLITCGEYWRLLTACFLHANYMHILSNLIGLYFWGPHIEVLLGRTRYLIVYLFSGVFGSLLSYVCSPGMSVGASGAIFGMFGALLYFRTRHKQVFDQVFGMQVLVFIGLNLANGFMNTGVDNFGHIGGLIGGFCAAYCTGLYGERPRARHFAAASALLLASGALFVLGIYRYSLQYGVPMFTFIKVHIA